MKRISLHILFWLAYLVQDTMLAFLWDGPGSGHIPTLKKMLMAFELCFSLVPPKILFTYFILYYVLDRILKQRELVRTIIYAILLLFVLLLVVKAIELYFVREFLFHQVITVSFWRPFGFLFAFIDIGYITGIAIAIKQIRIQLAGKEREKALVKEKLETELKFLRNQTNPHFLFNTLNNIYGLALRKSDDTAEVVMKLSKLLRFMIYETKNPFIKIGDEIKMLDNFINLEKIRYTRKLTIEFKKDIDDDSEPITPLLLLPFVENAFKHGTGENRFESFINIQVFLREGVLKFCIENSKEYANSTGIVESVGLGNVKRQLELMYKDYDLKVTCEPTVFKVSLTVNLRSYANI